ncbi:MAG: FadR/GntR family transcriptional regulator [Methyloligellaceae bacterium]
MNDQEIKSRAAESPPARAKPARALKSETVYREVLARIMQGDFPVNSRLPTETALAAEFGASRPVVRQALARLREDGLIETLRGSGSVVCKRPTELIQKFAPLASIGDIQRCFEFRMGLEGEIAALAAMRRNSDDIANIRRRLEELDNIVETDELGIKVDYAFHAAIARAAHNIYYSSALDSLREQALFGMNLTRRLSLSRTRTRIKAVQAEHRAIFQAIRDGDPERARQAMRAHIQSAKNWVFESEQ